MPVLDAYMTSLARQHKVYDKPSDRYRRCVRVHEAKEIDNHQTERLRADGALQPETNITKVNDASAGVADQEWKKYNIILIGAAVLGFYLLMKGRSIKAGVRWDSPL
jgi:hypothetical protein